ncbi:MAG: biotin/lipoyl-binding protein, partial [Planctomycetota bacterium]
MLVILFTATNLRAQVLQSFAEPVELREVAAAEPGVVSKTFVQEGQSIEVGQLLAELQCEELRQKKRLAELRAESDFAIQAADALVRIREKKLAALRPMLESGHANQSEVEQAELEFDAAFSERGAARLAREEQKIQVRLIEAEIERRLIRSPIRGIVTEVHRQAGEFIAGAEPKFATIADLTKLRARFYLN